MKMQVWFAALFLLLSLGIRAQSEKYQKAMSDKISQMAGASTVDAWRDLSNAFERIAEAEKTQWLPYYYASMSRVMAGYMIGNGQMGGFADKSDPEADKAEALLDKAQAIAGDNSEIWCIRKMIATLRMSAAPMVRFQTYGPKAAEALDKARQLDPENPRVYLLEGQDKFFTPEQFGGSKAEAKVLFETCLKKAESFKPASPLHPTWGPSQASYFLGQIK